MSALPATQPAAQPDATPGLWLCGESRRAGRGAAWLWDCGFRLSRAVGGARGGQAPAERSGRRGRAEADSGQEVSLVTAVRPQQQPGQHATRHRTGLTFLVLLHKYVLCFVQLDRGPAARVPDGLSLH